MHSDVPKVLHGVLGIALVEHVVRAALAVGAGRVVLVVSPEHKEQTARALGEIEQLTLLEGQGMALWSPKEWDGLALVPRHRQILDDYLVDRDR